ncbi:hypothetical protein GCM10011519_08920 [Marmoricola endophyticus]|uniref:Uncharacterized protein n=1 Tax=Marmoricola endophyticus TaxID=2040280 RepID=A0A917BDE4_9ACTN|nr:hypothetical protein [Marmoricola endophyticus]GGF37562.1 hypothetical protein GCM10011519_08920 [Marmoricola endophyticus]
MTRIVHDRPSRLVTSGMVELAAGALTGWVYALTHTQPERAEAIGIRSGERVRQWHLDLVMMGSATVAAGLAAPDASKVAAGALAVGAWTNPSAFLWLALDPKAYAKPTFRAASVASFVVTTIGFTGVVASVVRRRLAA